MSIYKLFYITCKNKNEASKISLSLIKEDLAACANILPPVQSYFKWNKQTQSTREVIVIGKTLKKKMSKIIMKVKEKHSYDCPGIVFIDIKNGNKDFLNWIKNSLK
jgi:periplasmic divalent cation tolerance protein